MIGRSTFRVLRWVGLAAVAPALWACQARSLEAPLLKPESTFTKSFAQSINRNVDMLFLIDDSSSMRLSQENLQRNFPAFMTTLRGMPGGPGLPNLHVAVISSDMGAGDGSVQGCDSSGGKNGIFQYTPRGNCATNPLNGATYIIDSGGQKNYTGTLEEAFTCIAALGESGCGFEHQFAAITRALGADGRAAPSENQGFLRPEAYLAIVMITNEDDCSASPGDGPNGRIPLFDTGSNTTSCRSSARPRTSAATSSVTCADGMKPEPQRAEQRHHGDGQATTTARRTTPTAICSASGTPPTGSRRQEARREPGHRGGDHRAGDALHREVEAAEHGGHLVRRGVMSVAGDRALVRLRGR